MLRNTNVREGARLADRKNSENNSSRNRDVFTPCSPRNNKSLLVNSTLKLRPFHRPTLPVR